jgi:hypothetical protein
MKIRSMFDHDPKGSKKEPGESLESKDPEKEHTSHLHLGSMLSSFTKDSLKNSPRDSPNESVENLETKDSAKEKESGESSETESGAQSARSKMGVFL